MDKINKIKIKCPFCGDVLTVKDSPANAGKKVTCPTCRHVGQFEDFKKVVPVSNPEVTQISKTKEKTSFSIRDTATGREYRLKEGRNVIGRMTYKSAPKATVPIHTEDLGFSREHLFLDVICAIDGVTYCYASNASNKNQTYVNGRILKAGDRTGLSNGDEIKSSVTRLILIKKVESSGNDDTTRYNDETEI